MHTAFLFGFIGNYFYDLAINPYSSKDAIFGEPNEEIEKLKALMKIASNNLDFERCIEIRDTISKLKKKFRK